MVCMYSIKDCHVSDFIDIMSKKGQTDESGFDPGGQFGLEPARLAVVTPTLEEEGRLQGIPLIDIQGITDQSNM